MKGMDKEKTFRKCKDCESDSSMTFTGRGFIETRYCREHFHQAVKRLEEDYKEEKLKKKKYSVCAFPSLYGTHVETNFVVISFIVACYRSFSGSEIRVINNKTGNHIIVW